MNSKEEDSYKWLPTLGEWYRVDGEAWFFSNLSSLKNFYKNIDAGHSSGKESSKIEKFELGTWILITNITLGNDSEPAYLEFMIRKDQYNQSEEHAQKLYYLSMFPRLPFNPKDVRWTKTFVKVK